MHNSAWQALLRHIPAEQHNQYMLVTSSGVEIAVQNLLRVESELIIFKGRLAGSQDQGRLYFLPYCQIDYLGSTRAFKDTEVDELFGTLVFPRAAAEAQAPAEAPVEALPANGDDHPPAPRPGSESGIKAPIRSEVLDRFRNRGAAPAP